MICNTLLMVTQEDTMKVLDVTSMVVVSVKLNQESPVVTYNV